MYKKTENSTVHGLKTPFGVKTPHRVPTKSTTQSELIELTKQLYPTGKIWVLPEESIIQMFHHALNLSMVRLTEDVYSVVNSVLPDNKYFSKQDCSLWEYKLGLNTNDSLSVQERMTAIKDKMSYSYNSKYRQGKSFIEYRLQRAGFDVGVYENIVLDEEGKVVYDSSGFPERIHPKDVLISSGSGTRHGPNTRHGASTKHGASNYDIVANSMFEENYSIGGDENLWATFYICSKDGINQRAQIDKTRESEFRELVLKLKPAHTVAFLMINFI